MGPARRADPDGGLDQVVDLARDDAAHLGVLQDPPAQDEDAETRAVLAATGDADARIQGKSYRMHDRQKARSTTVLTATAS